MKTKTCIARRALRLALALALFATFNLQLPTAFAQGTAFTYQGRLTDGTNVANGNYDLTFSVWDSVSGPTQIGSTQTNRPVAVSNGLFTVALDFGSGIFTGSARWLEIGVRTNGSAEDYTPLNPRQPLSAAPYAVMAGMAGALPSGSISNSQIASGQVVKSLNGLKDNVVLNNGANVTVTTNGNVLTINSSGSGAFSLNGNDAYYTAGNVGIGTSSPLYPLFVRATGTSRPIGWERYVSGVQSGKTWAWEVDGAGTYVRNVTDVTLPLAILNNGNVGIGTTSPGAKLQVNTDEEGIRLRGNASSFFSKALMTFYSASSTFPPFPSTRMGYVGDASPDDYDIYLNADVGNVHLSTSAGTVLTASSSGNVGIGTATPAAPLDVVRYQGYVRLLSTNSSNGSVLELRNNTPGFGVSLGAINFAGFDGNVPGQIAFFEDGTMLFRATVVSVPVLQINGADVAEPFEMSAKNLPKGSVVIIDEENPGQLKPSDRAYDTRVAGILSGANGINSGIRLRQQGFNDHGENVALSGRVYAQADASFGAIKPGDLLTTSDTPGHCMKVTDHARAQGAIIGKAMSALQEGKGMVLVLVSLQ